MVRLIRRVLLSLCLMGLSCLSLADLPKKIHLATTDWCPYACTDAHEGPGAVYEYVSELLKQQGIEVKIDFYPWSRAIHQVNTGRLDGLLTAIPQEAPDLLFTQAPIMSYQVCFFSSYNVDWRYQGTASLQQIKLGAVRGYGYGEPIDSYLADQSNHKQISFISGENATERLFYMLETNRIHAFMDDKYVLAWQIHNGNLNSQSFKSAGCLPEIPFYLAVQPDRPWAEHLLTLLNQSFQDPVNQKTLTQLFAKYLSQ